MYTHTYACIDIGIETATDIDIDTDIDFYTHVYVRVHIHTYIYIYIHIHILHIYIYTFDSFQVLITLHTKTIDAPGSPPANLTKNLEHVKVLKGKPQATACPFPAAMKRGVLPSWSVGSLPEAQASSYKHMLCVYTYIYMYMYLYLYMYMYTASQIGR